MIEYDNDDDDNHNDNDTHVVVALMLMSWLSVALAQWPLAISLWTLHCDMCHCTLSLCAGCPNKMGVIGPVYSLYRAWVQLEYNMYKLHLGQGKPSKYSKHKIISVIITSNPPRLFGTPSMFCGGITVNISTFK